MKILLQHTRTGLYVSAPGEWAVDLHLATDFQHSKKAVDFARQHRLTDVQFAVRFIDSKFDEHFPLSAASPHGLPGRRQPEDLGKDLPKVVKKLPGVVRNLPVGGR